MIDTIATVVLQPLFIIKGIIVTALVLYIGFAFVLYQQIKTMNAIVEVKNSSPILHTVSLVHLLLALSLFILGLVIL